MINTKFTSIVAGILLLGACTTPVQQTTATMHPYDHNTEYTVEPRTDGYVVAVNYSRYQFFPQNSVIEEECKSTALSIARKEAEKAGRKIQPISEQSIVVSTGRNRLTGISSCSASVPAQWQ